MALTGTCDKPGCTVAVTGTCLLTHADTRSCPNFVLRSSERTLPAPVALLRERLGRMFPAGLELGSDDAQQLMRARYTYMVGILGTYNAGKTCYLLSLYMMAARGELPSGYAFAGSETLFGFEQRARHLRAWRGGPLPQQLADHTRLDDPRRPGLLHLALNRGVQRTDVILTDLPGEWTKNLVDRAATAERLRFLRRADGLLIVIDGPSLNTPKRHSEVQRCKHLIERLLDSVGVAASTTLVFVITKCDEIDMHRPADAEELLAHARTKGFTPHLVMCAAFSRTPAVTPNGTGVFDALKVIIDQEDLVAERRPPRHQLPGLRMFDQFGAYNDSSKQ
jgi:hypothetical protein